MPAPWLLSCLIAVIIASGTSQAIAHDIPKQRVDRTLQLVFEPGRLRLEYALELDDTTIAADLRRLNPGPLPPDPDQWLAAYGELIAPRLAESVHLSGPNGPLAWKVGKITRTRQQHTIYNLTFDAPLAKPGSYRLRDTNFGTSEGLSRMGVKSTSSMVLTSQGRYPEQADAEPYQPVWLLDNEALKQTRQWSGSVQWNETQTHPNISVTAEPPLAPQPEPTPLWAAFLLGLWHTLQPGHGKSWLAAVAARTNPGLAANISLISGWALSHFAVIALLAIMALVISPESLTGLSLSLKHLAALLIAVPAAHRLGMQAYEKRSQKPSHASAPANHNPLPISTLSTGLTAGLVPCWEAVGLLLLGISAGHPSQGLALVGSFIGGGLAVMIVMILTARIVGQRLYHSPSVSYVFMMGLDVVVLACGLRLLLA